MCVLLGFGNPQLGFAEAGHILAQAIGQLLRGISAGSVNVGCVLGQHDEVSQFRMLATLKTVEVLFHEAACHLAGAIGAEVHEYNGVTVVDGAFVIAAGHDTGGFYKLVVLAALVGLLQRGHRIS